MKDRPMRTPNRHRSRKPIAALLVSLLALVSLVRPDRASAHPLGNFTINQYTRIELSQSGPRLFYVLDMAEIPALQEIQAIDHDGDGAVGELEQQHYLPGRLAQIARSLDLRIGGEPVALQPVDSLLTFPEGQAGLKLLRLEAIFTPAAPVATLTGPVSYKNGFDADRLGWKEIVVVHDAGLDVAGAVSTASVSDELRSYPADLLKSPLDQTEIAFDLSASPAAKATDGYAALVSRPLGSAPVTASRPNGGETGTRFAALLNGDDLTGAGIAVALLLAMLWGALHALSPGHGKTVVGAYLVGSRGTPKHALFLGLTVTITHTAGVLALGAVTLFASRFILPEHLFPWLSGLSGATVIAMGLFTLRQRLRGAPALGHHHHDHDHDHAHDHRHDPDHAHDHHHDHEHDHVHTHSHGGHTHSHLPPGADGQPVTWRALLALGISGGLIPCPSALLVLLGSIALGRVGFGLALVVAFSLGLAATLSALGLAFLYAGRYLERRIRPTGRTLTLLKYAPVLGSVGLTLAGAAILARALGY
jgi:ABC-type nickel/cobalt efflux system permease component RcnA